MGESCELCGAVPADDGLVPAPEAPTGRACRDCAVLIADMPERFVT